MNIAIFQKERKDKNEGKLAKICEKIHQNPKKVGEICPKIKKAKFLKSAFQILFLMVSSQHLRVKIRSPSASLPKRLYSFTLST
jgi:hypothetical protein